MVEVDFEKKTKELIDNLKSISASYGLGNDGNEFKIITQVFLYKFLNDKFAFEVKIIDSKLKNSENWEQEIKSYSDNDYEMLLLQLGADTAKLYPRHFISSLFVRQNERDFAKLFDDTLLDIAILNNDIFAVKTDGGAKESLFDPIAEFVTDPMKRDNFVRAIINKLVEFDFEHIFNKKFDFYATIFEYLIKDYNSNSGGKYAEYFTPHSVAEIMASILVNEPTQDVTVYDPAAGSGTLLMSVAHAIGEDKCTLYSQDISQKSSSLLRLNLILNNLIHSIQNIIQGNTLTFPYHKNEKGELQKFDYVVSNPPFKLKFSDYRDDLDTKENHKRFFAGIPKIPNKAKNKMAIYLLFVQHIIYSLSSKGKAAVVVPTGFITAQNGIEKKIREYLINNKMLSGVVSMPSNIFAATGTNVSILFINKNNKENVVLIDASKLGDTVKDGKNQRTVLQPKEKQKIIETFNNRKKVEDFSVVVNYDEIKQRNYSFSAGQYFDVKIEYIDITQQEFETKLNNYQESLKNLFEDGEKLEKEIQNIFKELKYE